MANKEVITKWVEALESGEFTQARGSLKVRRNDGKHAFCCLGVLCELAVEDGVIEPAVEAEDKSEITLGYQYEINEQIFTESGVLPAAVRDWAGLRANNPAVHYEDESDRSLTGLNDTDQLSFRQIAAVIRSNFLETVDA